MHRFDRFTKDAQDAAERVFEVLHRFGDTQADTEHMLLALIEQPEGVVPEILKALDADSGAIARQLDEDMRRTRRSQIYSSGVSQVYITPRLKRVIDTSNDEAVRLNDDYIATEHLFLAIAKEQDTIASRALARAGASHRNILAVLPEVRSARAAPVEPRQYRVAGGVRVVTQAGAKPQLLLAQGTNQVGIALQDVMPLIAALAQAAAELAADQEKP